MRHVETVSEPQRPVWRDRAVNRLEVGLRYRLRVASYLLSDSCWFPRAVLEHMGLSSILLEGKEH